MVRDSAVHVYNRTRRLLVSHLLGLDDTPHRIALGVFLGFLVGMTPTLGFQMVIYFAIAALVGANKLSGLGPIWLSNPVTAVPLYYANWKIGHLLMTGQLESSAETRAVIGTVMGDAEQEQRSMLERFFSADFWQAAIDAVIALGVELWVGSLLVGLVLGVFFYWLTHRAVTGYRYRRYGTPPESDA